MKSNNFKELIRVADLLNSNLAITQDKITVDIIETTNDGYIYLKAYNTNSAFDNKFKKELIQSDFKDVILIDIDIDITIFKILLYRD